MILPKGTIDFSKKGGENAMEELLDQIGKEKTDGYILVMGTLEDLDGNSEEITAQLLFENGEPKLCEAVVNKTAMKGIKGIHHLLRSTITSENMIEMHSKIDVGPPLAFFKECKIEKEDMDITAFKEKMEREIEERRQLEEERRRKKEMEDRINEEVSTWLDSGFKIEKFPAIMEKDHDEIMNWHQKLSSDISEIHLILSWASKIDEVEVKDLVEKLIERSVYPDKIDEIIEIKGDIEAKVDDIGDKRKEMERWVNLWKDEGYNTEKIEETLSADLETAWNSLTIFMDDIQRLKEHREELENLRRDDPDDHFGSETREIDFLLNDPLEMENIIKLIWELKEIMGNEKDRKEELLNEAKEWKEKGYDISRLVNRFGARLDPFKTEHQTFINNISRIEQIKDEIKILDRRDLSDRIDEISTSMTDPFHLIEYETTLSGIRDELESLNKRRAAIKEDISSIKEEGYMTEVIEKEFEEPVDKLTTLVEDFRSKIGELKDIEANLSDMDHRWLENEFKEIEGKIKDVSNIEEVKGLVRSLHDTIESRERERAKVRTEMELLESDGFKMDLLKNVIEDDQDLFKKTYDDLKAKVDEAKGLIATLSGLNVKFFPQESERISEMLHDISILEDAKLELFSLKEKIATDWKIRNDLKDRLKLLKDSGWDISSLDNITDTSPDVLMERMNDLTSQVDDLQNALEDIDTWDRLESKILSGRVEECKRHLRNIADVNSALEHYNDIKAKIHSNKDLRDRIMGKVEEWKESGYVLNTITDKLRNEIEELNTIFEGLVSKIKELESFQEEFDGLKIDHFKSEAEEIEFKMNDPGVVEEISKELEELKNMIGADENKRSEFMGIIQDYMKKGFMGAEKLENFMNEDISIVALEFKNFEKEVTLFKKYMESTGFQFPKAETGKGKTEKKEKKEEKVEPEETKEKTEKKEVKEEGVAPDPDLNFANFIVDSPNEVAYNAAMEVSEKPGEAYNPLLILGEKGTGKTHLINSISLKVREEAPNIKIVSFDGKRFIEKIKEHRSSETMEEFREIFRTADMLIMDDIDQMKGEDDGQEMFINVMNGLLDNNKQVILASERDIKSLPLVAGQIRNRLDKGVSVDLEGPTIEMNTKLISKFGSDRVPDNISNYIANNLLGSVSDIKLAVDLFLGEMENRTNDALEKVKEIVDKISGDMGQTKSTETREDTSENVNKEEPEEIVVCTNCDKEIPADSKECPHCNAVFEDIEMKECPGCHELVELDKKKCPGCGHKF